MKTCRITQSGIEVDVTMVCDSQGGYWLVLARWSMSCGGVTVRTMPPLDPDLTEDEAWGEAKAWASRRLTREVQTVGGLAPLSGPDVPKRMMSGFSP
jgi:hypothetical protein